MVFSGAFAIGQAAAGGGGGGGAVSSTTPDEYYFITTPGEISWSKGSSATALETYGTNGPFVQYGNTKLRNLRLGNALLEGFSDGKEVESNVTNLEACMNMRIETGKGYAAPYVWKVFSGDKSYGNFVITSVDVTEEMRDLSGKATRAYVDVSLQEVPEYQISTGVDLASKASLVSLTSSAISALGKLGSQDGRVAAAKAASGAAGGAAGGAGGAGNSLADTTETPPGILPNVPISLF